MRLPQQKRQRLIGRIGLLALIAVVYGILTGAPGAPVANPFGIESFDGGSFDAGGGSELRAGTRPASASTTFLLDGTTIPAGTAEYSNGELRDATVELAPGLVGNPQAAPTCTLAQLSARGGEACPIEANVGYVILYLNGNSGQPGNPRPAYYPIYNMQAPVGTPALFGFNIGKAIIFAAGKVRTGDDYGVTVASRQAAETLPIKGVSFVVWGVPADPAHDDERGSPGLNAGTSCADPEASCSHASTAPLKPFFTLPTSCLGPARTGATLTSWQGEEDSDSFLSHLAGDPNALAGNEDCASLDFSPSLEARPTTDAADSPSGLHVDLRIPQHENCAAGPPVSCERAEANLRNSVVTLPAGMTINPSAANGLGACSETQFGFTGREGDVVHTTADPAQCPDAAKLGTLEVDTPLLDHPVEGAVYIAAPHQNPFGSLLALYLTASDPLTGVVVKLAGEVRADPQSGQLTATFRENPQLPFEDLHLDFFGGAGGSLRTPATCGGYSVTSSLTPWSAPESGPPATPGDSWAINRSPVGGSCAGDPSQLPNSPSLEAGTEAPVAGVFSPLVVKLHREDGSQQFRSLTLTPPQGLVGKLAGVPYCPQLALDLAGLKAGRDEEAHPSCPSQSYVGSVSAVVGAGPAPYHASGTAYLAGPYKGAPVSLAVVTPAVAGPFDLGTIVVRVALQIDPKTTQITAVSDPLPTILEGIPLDIRSIGVKLDRPGFTLNPTSCNPTSFLGQLTSTLGQAASISNRFQVGNCGALGFKPGVHLQLHGKTRRGAYQRLIATVTPRAGDANIARAAVTLPHSEFLAQEHIRTVCTRVQFAARACPPGSIYGHAEAVTPLLDEPLSGPVYLRSSDNPLPDLVAALRGPDSRPIEVELAGRTDSKNGGIRNTFDLVPDAPVSRFNLQLFGGQKSLIVNSRDLCGGRKQRATAHLDAQNGLQRSFRPVVRNDCGKRKKKQHR
jgi:hypothetical protein